MIITLILKINNMGIIETIICIIGLLVMVLLGFVVLVVIFGIIMSFFGKNIYWEDLEDESNTEKQ